MSTYLHTFITVSYTHLFFSEKDIKNQESNSLKRAIRKYQIRNVSYTHLDVYKRQTADKAGSPGSRPMRVKQICIFGPLQIILRAGIIKKL